MNYKNGFQRTFGIMAGASTPNSSIEEVKIIQKIYNKGIKDGNSKRLERL